MVITSFAPLYEQSRHKERWGRNKTWLIYSFFGGGSGGGGGVGGGFMTWFLIKKKKRREKIVGGGNEKKKNKKRLVLLLWKIRNCCWKENECGGEKEPFFSSPSLFSFLSLFWKWRRRRKRGRRRRRRERKLVEICRRTWKKLNKIFFEFSN